MLTGLLKNIDPILTGMKFGEAADWENFEESHKTAAVCDDQPQWSNLITLYAEWLGLGENSGRSLLGEKGVERPLS